MAYESNDRQYQPFSIKFARSDDLRNWTKLPDTFSKERYAACPAIRHVDGYYYVLYVERQSPRWYFETYIARSKDLKTWQRSPSNPVLSPDWDEGINTSDPDIIEFEGRTYLYYSIGDQRTWTTEKRATYAGSMGAFFREYFVGASSLGSP